MTSCYRAIIYYPPCLGGNWLNSTIHGLETGSRLPSGTNRIFDLDKKSQKILCTHLLDFEKWHIDPVGISDEHLYLFSSSNLYFHFCQRAYKGYLNSAHGLYIDLDHIGEKALELMNVGQYLLTDVDFSQYYNNINLNYDWIFYNQNKFVNQLIDILYPYDIEIDCGYILSSIEVYKQNSLDPTKIIGDRDNFIWLSWCLVWLEHQQKTVFDFLVRDSSSITELASNLERYQNLCIESTLELCKQSLI